MGQAISRVFPLEGKLSRRALMAVHEAEQAYHESEAIVLDLRKDARIVVSEPCSSARQLAIHP